MPFSIRTSAAVLCIAIAVCSAFAPALAPDAAEALLTEVWQYEPPSAVAVLRSADARSEEQTASLLRLVLSRAPPQHDFA
jgi:hypothetical protein